MILLGGTTSFLVGNAFDHSLVDELPHTATGKLLKTRLREQFRGHRLPTDPA